MTSPLHSVLVFLSPSSASSVFNLRHASQDDSRPGHDLEEPDRIALRLERSGSSDWTAPQRFLLHSELRDQRQEQTLELTPSADVVDSGPSLARSPSPFDRRIAPHARPWTGYGRFRHQLLRTDFDIDSTSGRSIWNADSTADKYWQLWPGTDIRSASRQFSLTRQFDTSVIQRSRCVRVKSCLFTPEALGDSGLPLDSSATR